MQAPPPPSCGSSVASSSSSSHAAGVRVPRQWSLVRSRGVPRGPRRVGSSVGKLAHPGWRQLLKIAVPDTARVNDAVNADGWTGLHFCAKGGNHQVALVLLRAGADPRARSKQGQTPLAVAAFHGHAEVAYCLLRFGAEPLPEEKKGEEDEAVAAAAASGGALGAALRRRNTRLVRLLSFWVLKNGREGAGGSGVEALLRHGCVGGGGGGEAAAAAAAAAEADAAFLTEAVAGVSTAEEAAWSVEVAAMARRFDDAVHVLRTRPAQLFAEAERRRALEAEAEEDLAADYALLRGDGGGCAASVEPPQHRQRRPSLLRHCVEQALKAEHEAREAALLHFVEAQTEALPLLALGLEETRARGVPAGRGLLLNGTTSAEQWHAALQEWGGGGTDTAAASTLPPSLLLEEESAWQALQQHAAAGCLAAETATVADALASDEAAARSMLLTRFACGTVLVAEAAARCDVTAEEAAAAVAAAGSHERQTVASYAARVAVEVCRLEHSEGCEAVAREETCAAALLVGLASVVGGETARRGAVSVEEALEALPLRALAHHATLVLVVRPPHLVALRQAWWEHSVLVFAGDAGGEAAERLDLCEAEDRWFLEAAAASAFAVATAASREGARLLAERAREAAAARAALEAEEAAAREVRFSPGVSADLKAFHARAMLVDVMLRLEGRKLAAVRDAEEDGRAAVAEEERRRRARVRATRTLHTREAVDRRFCVEQAMAGTALLLKRAGHPPMMPSQVRYFVVRTIGMVIYRGCYRRWLSFVHCRRVLAKQLHILTVAFDWNRMRHCFHLWLAHRVRQRLRRAAVNRLLLLGTQQRVALMRECYAALARRATHEGRACARTRHLRVVLATCGAARSGLVALVHAALLRPPPPVPPPPPRQTRRAVVARVDCGKVKKKSAVRPPSSHADSLVRVPAPGVAKGVPRHPTKPAVYSTKFKVILEPLRSHPAAVCVAASASAAASSCAASSCASVAASRKSRVLPPVSTPPVALQALRSLQSHATVSRSERALLLTRSVY